MQVLVALAKAHGAIVTRDELIRSCWDGRVVGDDAINRVIGRLRKAADGIGAGSFRVETVTRIGHRLTSSAEADNREVDLPGRHTSRRGFALGATAATVLLAAGGGAILYRRLARPALSPEVQGLMVEADQALNQVTWDGLSQAIGLYRRVVEVAPDFADGWGMLGFAYGMRSHFSPGAESEALRRRAETAGRRALELAPGNANGELALATALPLVGHWQDKQAGFERALAADPGNYNARRSLAAHLYEVGRLREALAQYREMRVMRCPAGHYGLVEALWSAGRLEEADKAMEEAASLYPAHPAIWRLRYELQAFGGRPAAAFSLVSDLEERPVSVTDQLILDLQASARAIQSRDQTAVDAVMRSWMRHARDGSADLVVAMRMASAFDRMDEAFELADAYHLGRHVAVADEGDRGPGAGEIPLDQRGTSHLFEPVTSPMRADARFERLVADIGLQRYWRETGMLPDYRRS